MFLSRVIPDLLKHSSRRCLLLQQLKMAKQISTTHERSSAEKMSNFQPVTHVIFDMDGLLLDTVPMYETIRRRVLADFGCDYDFHSNISMQGLLSSEVSKMMVEQFKLPITADEYSRRSSRVAAEVFRNSQLMPDTEIIYEEIISNIVEKYGKKYTEDVKLSVLGTNEQTTAKLVVSMCGLPITVDELLTQFRISQRNELGKCGFMPGAERLIRHLYDKQVPIAVATSSGKESVAIKTEKFKDIFGLFHHMVMGSSDPEVKNGKPAPDIFQVCASRFDDKPSYEKCLVFEDAPNGVTGARAAGMQTVMVPDPHLPADRTTHATLVIRSLLDFKPEEFGLPAF